MRAYLLLLALCGTAAAGSVPELALARGKALLAGGDRTAAVVAFDDVAVRFPASPRAAEAAMLALDTLDRDERFDDLVAYIDRYIHDRPLMRNRAFARELRHAYMKCCMRRDVAPPPTDFEREALDRLEQFAIDPQAPFSDELLWAAGWQFCVSHHPDAAGRAWRVLVALSPRSTFARSAKTGLADLATCEALPAS